MGKKLGLDKQYSSLLTSVNKNSPSRSYNLGPITEGTPKSPFIKRGLNLTTSVNKVSKLLNVGKKVFGRTPIGKAVGLAIAAGQEQILVMNMVKINLKVLRKILKE
jgi:hypothetical protein